MKVVFGSAAIAGLATLLLGLVVAGEAPAQRPSVRVPLTRPQRPVVIPVRPGQPEESSRPVVGPRLPPVTGAATSTRPQVVEGALAVQPSLSAPMSSVRDVFASTPALAQRRFRDRPTGRALTPVARAALARRVTNITGLQQGQTVTIGITARPPSEQLYMLGVDLFAAGPIEGATLRPGGTVFLSVPEGVNGLIVVDCAAYADGGAVNWSVSSQAGPGSGTDAGSQDRIQFAARVQGSAAITLESPIMWHFESCDITPFA